MNKSLKDRLIRILVGYVGLYPTLKTHAISDSKTVYLSYGYLKLGSRVKIDNYLVKTMTYSQYKNKWFMNLNIQLRLSTIILIY